jgi:S-adenosylmethionine:tRNA ribosyltransferase-isomerase
LTSVRVADFNYSLPEELIAQEPPSDRAGARLLHLNRSQPELRDLQFRDFPDLLRTDDLVVFNNTRVFPARLYGRRVGVKAQPLSPENPASRDFLRGRIEVLLTRQLSREPNEWECLVRPGRKVGVGERLFFGEQDQLQAEVIARGSFGQRHIRPDNSADRERYQTIYARERGSVAAPTAGLHFTQEILARMKARGIETAEITLHVGLGTFQPVREDRVEDHKLHREAYSIPTATASAINHAFDAGRRIVAIGTTTVRALEHAAAEMGRVEPGSGEADIFIFPGFEFRVVGALLTNFHLPQSTLLMLVCALGGQQRVLHAYHHAVAQRYRFYSYGDCMLVE